MAGLVRQRPPLPATHRMRERPLFCRPRLPARLALRTRAHVCTRAAIPSTRRTRWSNSCASTLFPSLRQAHISSSSLPRTRSTQTQLCSATSCRTSGADGRIRCSNTCLRPALTHGGSTRRCRLECLARMSAGGLQGMYTFSGGQLMRMNDASSLGARAAPTEVAAHAQPPAASFASSWSLRECCQVFGGESAAAPAPSPTSRPCTCAQATDPDCG